MTDHKNLPSLLGILLASLLSIAAITTATAGRGHAATPSVVASAETPAP